MSSFAATRRAAAPSPKPRAVRPVSGAGPERLAASRSTDAARLPIFLGGYGASAAAMPRFLSDLGSSSRDGAALIQRRCACGSDAGGSLPCEACASSEGVLQPKLSLSRPGDAFEQEADRVADAVISGAAVPAISPVSPAPAAVQAKSEGAHASAGTANAAQAVSSGGRPLDAAEQAYFEPRFGRDLSSVRVHTNGNAGQAARAINATAYTLSNHIAFASGAYHPGTESGRRLMAHELAHTLQQGQGAVIRRTCPGGTDPQPAGLFFEAKAWAIRGLPSYQKLDAEQKKLADHIIDGARGSACPTYYIDKLYTLFTTPEQDEAEQAAAGAAEIEAAEQTETVRVAEEKKKVATGAVKEDTTQVEEKIAGHPDRRWTPRVGQGGKLFYVDARDVNNIVVLIQVRLKAAGSGTVDDVKGIKALEDGIEKSAAARGYTVEIVFVERSGPDVFEADVDTAQWTTSGNWVGDVRTMAHEAHHLLGLEDRYNYIESHADNKGMKIPDRLYWFREQMVRGPDPTSRQSMMSEHQTYGFDDFDVCAVAKEKSEVTGCVKARVQGLGMDELVQRGEALSAAYEPQNAAILRLMFDTWQSQCFARYPEQLDGGLMTFGGQTVEKCWVTDCRKPPEDAFGRVYTLSSFWDEWSHPLANPHDQPAGSSLKRASAPWWMPAP
jgi:hypothetical protein